MSHRWFALMVCWSFWFCVPLRAQESPRAAAPFLRRSYATLTAGARIRDLTLNGTATHYGSNTEWGNVVLTAVALGQSVFDVSLPSGEQTEARSLPEAAAMSPQSTQSTFNVFGSQASNITPAWFFPAYAMAPGVAASGYASSYVAHETRQDAEVEHLTISQVGTDGTQSNTEDVYLDSTSHLPVAIDFNLHDDSGAPPIEIQYSDYRDLNGGYIAYHVQVYVQSALVWDIQLSSYSINTSSETGEPSN